MKATYKIRVENHYYGKAHGEYYKGVIVWEATLERHIAPDTIVETIVGEGSAETEEEALAEAQERIESIKSKHKQGGHTQ